MPDDVPDPRHDILEAAFPGQQVRHYLAMQIGSTPEGADEGAALILGGRKTATSSLRSDYADGRIPFVGALSVLLDGQARPVGIVETTGLHELRFHDVTDDMARAYGEGDRTLGWWRREMGAWYRQQAARAGRTFGDDDLLLWEQIRVVHRGPFPPAGAPRR